MQSTQLRNVKARILHRHFYVLTRDPETRQCSGSLLLFHIKSTLTNSHYILIYALIPCAFWSLTPRQRHISKTFPFCKSNRGTQKSSGRKSHLSKPLLFVSNQRLPYKLVDLTYFSALLSFVVFLPAS